MPFNLQTLTWIAKPVSLSEAKRIIERDHHRCQYCGLDGDASFENSLQIGVDFVLPRAKHGRKIANNLVACCRSCNMLKGRRIFPNFAAAKDFVLARRQQLRENWEARRGERKKTSARASSEPRAS